MNSINERFIFLWPTTPNEVFNKIMSLNNTRSLGTDGIPVVILKSIPDVISMPLSHIINLCMDQGTYPNLWKKSIISPLYKKGDKSKFENYRPLNLISNMSKIFEKILAHRLMIFLKTTKLSPNIKMLI